MPLAAALSSLHENSRLIHTDAINKESLLLAAIPSCIAEKMVEHSLGLQIGTLSFNPSHRPLIRIYLALTWRMKFRDYFVRLLVNIIGIVLSRLFPPEYDYTMADPGLGMRLG